MTKARLAGLAGLLALLALGVALLATVFVLWLPTLTDPPVPVPTFPPPTVAVTYEIAGIGQAQVAMTDDTGQPRPQGWQRLPFRATVTTAGHAWLAAAAEQPGRAVTCRIFLDGELRDASTGRGSVTCRV